MESVLLFIKNVPAMLVAEADGASQSIPMHRLSNGERHVSHMSSGLTRP